MKKLVLLSISVAFSLFANEMKNLNDMTVTAQKTEESVQDIPIAVNIFDDVSLEDKQITDLKDLSYYVPNFYYLSGYGSDLALPTIRGISSQMELLSPTVGLYIDGVSVSSSVGFNTILEDIQRVEVLKGPQGTLYGRNTEGGVVSVVTKKPDNTLEGKIGLSYGEDNKQQVLLGVRAPIIQDKFYIGLTGLYDRKDGFIENKHLNGKKDDTQTYFGKVYLRATPTDRLELSLISSMHELDNDGLARNILTAPKPRVYEGNFIGYNRGKNQNHALKVQYEFDNFQVKSTTTYSKNKVKAWQDLDFSQLYLSHALTNGNIKNISEELNIDGQMGRLKWLVGFFADRQKDNIYVYNHSSLPKYLMEVQNETINKSFGAYTNLNYALTDKLNIIGGVRYDKAKSDFKGVLSYPGIQYATNFDEHQDSSDVSPKLAFEYKWTPSFMTYITMAKGYKSGGFYIYGDPKYPIGYDKESLWSYEAGFKTSVLDNKLQINADIYYADIEDKQVVAYTSTVLGRVTNEPAKSYGFEIDGNYFINSHYSLFATFGYNKATFDDVSKSYSGNYIPLSPKYSYSLGSTFRGFGGMYASANLRGYGKMYLDNANKFERKGYTLVDAKVGYEWKNFDIYIYANNLFDKNYDLVGYVGNHTALSSPREIGAKFTYRF